MQKKDNLSIARFADKKQAAKEAGQALDKLLAQNFQDPVLLLLSGGSALEILGEVDEEVLGEQLSIAMLDDRFSQDPAENNFLQLQETEFYRKALNRDCAFFGTLPRSNESLDGLAARLENNLRNWRRDNPRGKIFAVLGMGPDGHTAGIFPFANDKKKFADLFLSDHWVVGYDNQGQKPPPLRITVTATFLKNVDEAVVFVTGKEKGPALEKVLTKQGELHKLPALIWGQMKHVRIFTDVG